MHRGKCLTHRSTPTGKIVFHLRRWQHTMRAQVNMQVATGRQERWVRVRVGSGTGEAGAWGGAARTETRTHTAHSRAS